MQKAISTLILALTQFAGANMVSGKVTAMTGGTALDQATVIITATGAPDTAKTDTQGNYTFPDVAPGSYQITVSKTGYKQGSAAITVASRGDLIQNFKLISENSSGISVHVPGAGSKHSFYPLSSNRIRLTYPLLSQAAQVRVHLASGKVVSESRLHAGSTEHELRLESESAGHSLFIQMELQ